MKKIIALLLAVVMVFALVACASTAKTDDTAAETTPAETTETTEPAAEETEAPAEEETPAEPTGDAVGTDIKIGVVLIGDENEGYTYSHILGIQEATKALGISENNIVWKYSIGEDESCYDGCVDCVDQGCQIVITNSYGHQSFCRQAAEEYPDVQFVAMTGDTARADGLANFHNAFTGIYEARYVGGVVAGMKLQQLIDEGKVEDKNKNADGKIKIGYVGAYPYAEVVSGYTAFFLGVQSIVPDVAMQVQYTNSWFNITAENEAAKALIADGCIIVSQHADSTGAPAACQEALDAGTTVYCVGYNVDMLKVAPNAALTSPTNVWEVFYEYAFRAVMNGESFDQNWCQGYEVDAVTLTPLGESCAPGTQEKVDETIAAIKAGSLHVFDTSKFTVTGDNFELTNTQKCKIECDAEGHVTSAMMVDTDGDWVADSEEGIADGYYHESSYQSAPSFQIRIDGITELN